MSSIPLNLHRGLFIFIALFLTNCARMPLQNRESALRIATPSIQVSDDLDLKSLLNAVSSEIQFLENSPSLNNFIFGREQFSKTEYLNGLKKFLELGENATTSEAFYELIPSEFDFYEVYGQNNWGEVFITSYFAPIIEGSTQQTDHFSTPLYQAPDDLITVDLSLFDLKFDSGKKLRGRLKDHTLVPYYKREDIDTKKVFSDKKMEICWVDPLDSFFLQIQGSGTIHLDNGKTLYVNYAEQNGHIYEPIGKFLKDKIPLEKINLYTLETYLRTLSRTEMQSYLNKNPSYVFFKISDQNAITFLGIPATAGRTIATDRRYFPKGALAFLKFNKPVFPPSQDPPQLETPLPSEMKPVSRFVLDQDVGGAISGGGRVDLFWGEGPESKRYAGVIKSPGSLYYLAPKRSKK